jgi:hypothetical protein
MLPLLTIIIYVFVLFSSYIYPVLLYVNEHGWNPEYYNTLDLAAQISKKYDVEVGLEDIVALEGGVPEIAKYFNEFVTDNYATIGFYNARLLGYWTDRPFIDLTWPYGYQSILSILQEDNSSRLIDKLYESNIRYFLIPKSKPAGQYQGWAALRIGWDFYERLLNKTLLFQEINTNKYFLPIKEFDFYYLFRLFSPYEYDTSLSFEASFENFKLTNDLTSKIIYNNESITLHANASWNTREFHGVRLALSPLKPTRDYVTFVVKYSMNNPSEMYDVELWSVKDGQRDTVLMGIPLEYSASPKVLMAKIPAEMFYQSLFMDFFITTVTPGEYTLNLYYVGLLELTN